MGKSRVLTDWEIDSVMNGLIGRSHGERNRCLVLMSFWLSPKELSELKIGDVIDGDGQVLDEIRLVKKSGENRTIYVNLRLKGVIESYIKVLNTNTHKNPFFYSQKSTLEGMSSNTISQLFLQIYSEFGIKGCSASSGRKTLVNRMMNFGIKQKVIKRLSGHSAHSKLPIGNSKPMFAPKLLIHLI